MFCATLCIADNLFSLITNKYSPRHILERRRFYPAYIIYLLSNWKFLRKKKKKMEITRIGPVRPTLMSTTPFYISWWRDDAVQEKRRRSTGPQRLASPQSSSSMKKLQSSKVRFKKFLHDNA